MIEVGTAADAGRARRRTWTAGGVLFLASALLRLAPVELTFGAPVDFAMLLFWAGAIVFAIGLGRAGSVTARRPLGTGAIIALVAWQVLVGPLRGAEALMGTQMFGDDATQIAMMYGITLEVVGLALAVIAVVQIARVGVVAPPWHRAPAWALGAVVAIRVVVNGAAVAVGTLEQGLLAALFALITVVTAAAVAFLGVTALLLAARRPDETVVYASGG